MIVASWRAFCVYGCVHCVSVVVDDQVAEKWVPCCSVLCLNVCFGNVVRLIFYYYVNIIGVFSFCVNKFKCHYTLSSLHLPIVLCSYSVWTAVIRS